MGLGLGWLVVPISIAVSVPGTNGLGPEMLGSMKYIY